MTVAVNDNGRVFDREHAVISVFDHGFLYGEGVYETLRTYNGKPFLFDRHMSRLRRSAGMLSLPVPVPDAEIATRFADTMRAAGLGTASAGDSSTSGATSAGGIKEAYLRVLITRGIGDLSYDPAATPTSSIVVIAKPHVDPPASVFEHGVMVTLSTIVRNHPGSVNPMIKSNNLLNNALAMQEAVKRGAFEAIMRNFRGELAECTTANLFVVKGGAALTPPTDAGLLAGITREFLFEIAADAGIPMREQVLKDADLFGADEAFFTSTTREIVPIVKVDDRAIGSGKPGEVTKRLLAEFRRRAHA
jgi:branched-chain amino acid aminotransferase